VYRGIDSSSPAKRVAEARKFYKPGSVITEKAPLSTSINKAAAFDGDVQFVIQSKHGKPVSQFARDLTEDEVLFKSGSRFRVVKVDDAGDALTIFLDEVA
jgi:hypothetical protein